MIRFYLILAVVMALLATHAGAYLRGRRDGHHAEAASWQAREIETQARAAQEREALQRAVLERQQALDAKTREAANAASAVHTEFLPAKTIVRREVVEKPVYRDCRVGDGMRSALDAALRGRPGTAAGAESRGAPGVSG